MTSHSSHSRVCYSMLEQALSVPAPSRARGDKEHEDKLHTGPVILMVSGGADSSALAHLAATSPLDIQDGQGVRNISRSRLSILHVNHGLRGEDARADEDFVRDLARDLGMACYVVHADVRALAKNRTMGASNIEQVGRIVRYRAAYALARKLAKLQGVPLKTVRILSAHTASDVAETFLMNATKGSALPGLSSIPRRRGIVVRPLLHKTHEELCRYLQEHGWTWREDATNLDTNYMRAFMRHEIIPRLKEKNPQVVESIARACTLISAENAFLERLSCELFTRVVVEEHAHMITLDAQKLAFAERVLAARVVVYALRKLSEDLRVDSLHTDEILAACVRGQGKVSLEGGCRASVEHGMCFLFAERRSESSNLQGSFVDASAAVSALPAQIASTSKASPSLCGGWLRVPGTRLVEDFAGQTSSLSARLIVLSPTEDPIAFVRAHSEGKSSHHVFCDAAACGWDVHALTQQTRADATRLNTRLNTHPLHSFFLWVSAPQPGDIIYPFGMGAHSKKLSDLLQEAHVFSKDRPLTPVVRLAPEGKIVWVARIRQDERFRCTPHTRVLLELTIKSLS